VVSDKAQKRAFNHWIVEDWPRIEKMVSLVQQSKTLPGVALELGYAPGSASDWLVKQGWHCIGLDLNPRMSDTISLVKGNFQATFPFKGECFDLVLAGEVIEHTFDDEWFLAECHRILKPGGFLIVSTPNLCFSLNRLLVFLGKTPMFAYAPYHYHFYTRDTLARMIEAAKFKLMRVTGSHVLYSRRRHLSGLFFERLASLLLSFSAHLIILARKRS
jgi:SAM-dependent methyltransferase